MYRNEPQICVFSAKTFNGPRALECPCANTRTFVSAYRDSLCRYFSPLFFFRIISLTLPFFWRRIVNGIKLNNGCWKTFASSIMVLPFRCTIQTLRDESAVQSEPI